MNHALARLRRVLVKRCTLAEVRTLCFDLGVN